MRNERLEMVEFKQFEIFWIDLAMEAKIPCIIVSPNELNYLKTRLVTPISQKGFNAPFRVKFTFLNKEANILCDQIRCVSIDRIFNKICDLETKKQESLKSILLEMFA